LLGEEIGENITIDPEVAKKSDGAGTTKQKAGMPKPFDYEEYVEGPRTKREISFFARNPRLVRDAKERYGAKCMACAFEYEITYPEIGRGYIEVHHLDPISERASNKADTRLTSLNQVAVLCANCHRMIHRLIRKLGHPVSIDEFKKTNGIRT
jgi:predicted HNH restriction endonuclease